MKKVLKIFTVIIICIIVYVMIVFLPIYLSQQENQTEMKYWKKLSNYKRELELKELFDEFEWETVYIVKDNKMTGNEIDQTIGLECNLGTLDYEWFENKYVNRLIFINKDKCVYEFFYDTRYVYFDNLGDFVSYENSKYKIEKEMKKYNLKFVE